MSSEAVNLPPATNLTREQRRDSLREYDAGIRTQRQRKRDIADTAKTIIKYAKED